MFYVVLVAVAAAIVTKAAERALAGDVRSAVIAGVAGGVATGLVTLLFIRAARGSRQSVTAAAGPPGTATTAPDTPSDQ
jgi:hypothetical protein